MNPGAMGSILYYACCVNLVVLAALSINATEQVKATKNATKNTNRLLEYLASHPDTMMWFMPLT